MARATGIGLVRVVLCITLLGTVRTQTNNEMHCARAFGLADAETTHVWRQGTLPSGVGCSKSTHRNRQTVFRSSRACLQRCTKSDNASLALWLLHLPDWGSTRDQPLLTTIIQLPAACLPGQDGLLRAAASHTGSATEPASKRSAGSSRSLTLSACCESRDRVDRQSCCLALSFVMLLDLRRLSGP